MSLADLPYDLVLEYLPSERLEIKKMFGHRCLYFDSLMVMFMIAKEGDADNGICLATSAEHIPSLKKEIKSLRYLEAYGEEATGWRLIPADSDQFEADTERACKLILKRDPRIGREARSSKKRMTSKARKAKK